MINSHLMTLSKIVWEYLLKYKKVIYEANVRAPAIKNALLVDKTLDVFRRSEDRVANAQKKTLNNCDLMLCKKIIPFLWLIVMCSLFINAQEIKLREPDVPYEPTPQHIVEIMLKLANTHKGDIVYDLGCGDGRIVITAAKLFGATGVGIDIDPVRIEESYQNAAKARVMDNVTFRNEDLFAADIQEATVVTLFLSRSVNLKLRPKLLRELKPGTRVVSYYWDMAGWKPDKQIESDGDPIYIWTIPTKKLLRNDMRVCRFN